MLLWNVPGPNEALLISGSKHREQDMQFRIVTGHGSFVLPIKQGENQALIAANKLVDLLPSLVEASAKGIAGSNLTVLNGTEGVNQVAVANAFNSTELPADDQFAALLNTLNGVITTRKMVPFPVPTRYLNGGTASPDWSDSNTLLPID